jgi:PilZ domain
MYRQTRSRRMLGAHERRERPGAVAWDPWREGLPRSMGTGDKTPRRLERRWAPRYSFRAELEIEWGSAVIRGSTRDISSNGMFIESADTLWVGAGFTARLALDQPVKVDCFVKRVEPGRGMGVVVTVSEQLHQQRYQQLLTSLSTLTP